MRISPFAVTAVAALTLLALPVAPRAETLPVPIRVVDSAIQLDFDGQPSFTAAGPAPQAISWTAGNAAGSYAISDTGGVVEIETRSTVGATIVRFGDQDLQLELQVPDVRAPLTPIAFELVQEELTGAFQAPRFVAFPTYASTLLGPAVNIPFDAFQLILSPLIPRQRTTSVISFPAGDTVRFWITSGALVNLLGSGAVSRLTLRATAIGRDAGGSGTPTECSDGFDNDGDGYEDYPGDDGCDSADDPSEEGEPLQAGVILCGLGFELALLVPLLWARRSRRVM